MEILLKSGTLEIQILIRRVKLIFLFTLQKSPKSLGTRMGRRYNISPILGNMIIRIEDKMNTFCEHIGIQIGTFLQKEILF